MTTTITACTGPECTRRAEYADPARADRTATLCKGHYEQIRRHGRLKPLQARNAGRPCSRTGCTSGAAAKGLCLRHYQQARDAVRKRRPRRPPLDVLEAARDELRAHMLNERVRCAGDLGFASDLPEVRAASALLCADCPALDACRTAGKAETWGVWGGVDRSTR